MSKVNRLIDHVQNHILHNLAKQLVLHLISEVNVNTKMQDVALGAVFSWLTDERQGMLQQIHTLCCY